MDSDGDPLPETTSPVVPSPRCSRFGSTMEPGYLVIHSSGQYTMSRYVTWNEPSPEDDRPGAKLADLWTSNLGGSPWLKGYRCEGCEYLELGYGKGGLTRVRWAAVSP